MPDVAGAYVTISPDLDYFRTELLAGLESAMAGTDRDVKIGVDFNDVAAAEAMKWLSNLGSGDVSLGLDSSGFQAELVAAKAQLGQLQSQIADAKLGADDAPLLAAVAQASVAIDALSGKTVEINADIAPALAKLTALRAAMDGLGVAVGQAGADTGGVSIGMPVGGRGGGGGADIVPVLQAPSSSSSSNSSFLGPILAAMFAGGAGGTLSRILGTGGGGSGGIFGIGAGLPSLGSLGSFAGLGPEHLITTLLGVAGSAGGASLGGGLLAAGSAGTVAVGGGSDAAVVSSTIADTKTLSTDLTNLAQAQALYGQNSTQAALATAQLNYDMQTLGNTAGVQAELGLAKSTQALGTFWDQATSPARVQAVNILQQGIQTGFNYVPAVAQAATTNLGIINDDIKPLFAWINGPQGMGIFNSLEQEFASKLPVAIDAFTQGFELLAKTIFTASGYTGGFMITLDNFLTKYNTWDWSKWDTEIGKLIADFHVWDQFVVILVKDIIDLFKHDQGTGTSIIEDLTKQLDRLNAWENSAQGGAQLARMFEVHKKEVLAILSYLPSIVKLLGNMAFTLSPALTEATADALKFLTPLVDFLVKDVPDGGLILGLAIIASKLKILNPLLSPAFDALSKLYGKILAFPLGGLTFEELPTEAEALQSAAADMSGAAFDLSGAATDLSGAATELGAALAGLSSELPGVAAESSAAATGMGELATATSAEDAANIDNMATNLGALDKGLGPIAADAKAAGAGMGELTTATTADDVANVGNMATSVDNLGKALPAVGGEADAAAAGMTSLAAATTADDVANVGNMATSVGRLGEALPVIGGDAKAAAAGMASLAGATTAEDVANMEGMATAVGNLGKVLPGIEGASAAGGAVAGAEGAAAGAATGAESAAAGAEAGALGGSLADAGAASGGLLALLMDAGPLPIIAALAAVGIALDTYGAKVNAAAGNTSNLVGNIGTGIGTALKHLPSDVPQWISDIGMAPAQLWQGIFSAFGIGGTAVPLTVANVSSAQLSKEIATFINNAVKNGASQASIVASLQAGFKDDPAAEKVLSQWIIKNLDPTSVKNDVQGSLGNIMTGITIPTPPLTQAGNQAGSAVVTGFGHGVASTTPSMSDVINKQLGLANTTAATHDGDGTPHGAAIAKGLHDGAENQSPTAADALNDILNNANTAAGKHDGDGTPHGKALVKGLHDGIANASPTAADALNQHYIAIDALATNDDPMLTGHGHSLVVGLKDGLTDTVSSNNITAGVTNIFNDLSAAAKAHENDLVHAGENTLQGFANGLLDPGEVARIQAGLGNILSGLVPVANSAVGNTSPSKKFHQVGAYIMQGLALGISDNAALPIAAVGNALADMQKLSTPFGTPAGPFGGNGVSIRPVSVSYAPTLTVAGSNLSTPQLVAALDAHGTNFIRSLTSGVLEGVGSR